MASDWIKVEMSTPDKAEVMRLSRDLKLDRDTLVGKLIRVWAWFDQNSVDGNIDACVDADVDALVDTPEFAKHLRAVKWLQTSADGNGISMPNFERHNGKSSKKRALKSRRQQNWREKNVDSPVSTHASTRRDESICTSSRARKKRAPGVKTGDTEAAKAARLSTWKAYSTAYFNRYSTEPLRNALTNSLIASFCKAVPHAEAPDIAIFYVRHNKYAYTNSKHDLKIMVACASALHTDWKTGTQSTDAQARKLDQGQAQGSVWAKLQAENKRLP